MYTCLLREESSLSDLLFQNWQGIAQLRTHERRDPEPYRRPVEAGRAIEAVAIQERQRRLPEAGRPLGERFGQGRPLEKAEGAPGMQLHVH